MFRVMLKMVSVAKVIGEGVFDILEVNVSAHVSSDATDGDNAGF